MPDHPDLTALLGSRICHDLISPLGAIGNGVELLGLNGAAPGAELALIAESVDNANARIRFFRMAFGLASPEQRVGAPEAAGILADLWRGGRIRAVWHATGDRPRSEVKIAFLLLLCVESAMPWGGTVTIDHGDTGWTIRAEAARLRIDTAGWAALGHPSDAGPAALTPAEVQFALLPGELAAQGRTLDLDIREDAIIARF